MHRLVLGGEKCGKSAFAMARFLEDPAPRLLVVTGKAMDLGFRRQIERHRQERSPALYVQEVASQPSALPRAIAAAAEQGVASLLVDSMDFWLFGALGGEDAGGLGAHDAPGALGSPDAEDALSAPMAMLLETAAAVRERMAITFVSCEVGLGPIAASAAVRRFVRGLGACNQALAQCCDNVILVTAGLPLALKGQASGSR